VHNVVQFLGQGVAGESGERVERNIFCDGVHGLILYFLLGKKHGALV
jgi:hypothetical protein